MTARYLGRGILSLTLLVLMNCERLNREKPPAPQLTAHAIKPNEQGVWPFVKPDFSKIDQEPNAAEIRYGKELIERTSQLLPQYVKASLNCTNCHLNAGTQPLAGPFVGIVHRFPQYRDRSGKEDTLEDRINDCFERSENGQRLPVDHPAMKAIVAYMTWLSKPYPPEAKKIEGMGMPKLELDRKPNERHGRQVYETKCASCHQLNGQGIVAADGTVGIPPVWGPKSYNIGAGMARLFTAAGFVKHNMPLGQGNTLTDDEAYDVAYYFAYKDRPDFARKHLDWPKGNKPKDARY